jgi:hypothetical protein
VCPESAASRAHFPICLHNPLPGNLLPAAQRQASHARTLYRQAGRSNRTRSCVSCVRVVNGGAGRAALCLLLSLHQPHQGRRGSAGSLLGASQECCCELGTAIGKVAWRSFDALLPLVLLPRYPMQKSGAGPLTKQEAGLLLWWHCQRGKGGCAEVLGVNVVSSCLDALASPSALAADKSTAAGAEGAGWMMAPAQACRGTLSPDLSLLPPRRPAACAVR